MNNNTWEEELNELLNQYCTKYNHPFLETYDLAHGIEKLFSKQISEADQRGRDVAFEVSDKYIKQLKEVYKKRISEARRQGYDEGFNLARKINQDNRGNHSKASSDIDHTNCPKNGIALRCDHTSSNMPEMRCTGCGNCLSGSAPTGDVCVKILDCKCHKAISKSSYMPACCEECKCTGESMEVPDGLVSVACTWHNGDCHNEKCNCHQDN